MRCMYLAVLLVSVALGLETKSKKTVDDPLDDLLFHPVGRANDDTFPFIDLLGFIIDLLFSELDLYLETEIMNFVGWLMKEESIILEGVDPSNQRDVIQRFESTPCNKLCPGCTLLQPAELQPTCTGYCKAECKWVF